MLYSKLDFGACLARRKVALVKSQEIGALAVEDLLALKVSANRPKDAGDIVVLQRILEKRRD